MILHCMDSQIMYCAAHIETICANSRSPKLRDWKMNRILKKMVLLSVYGLMRTTEKSKDGLLVLTYHRISEKPVLDDALQVSVDTFEKQVVFLKNKYNIISGRDLIDFAQNHKELPPKSCLITFDDGWSDNYYLAFPILKRYHLPAVIFLSTNFIGTDKVFWHERLIEWINNIDQKEIKIDKSSACSLYIVRRITNILQIPKDLRRPYIDELIEHLKQYRIEEIESIFEDIGLVHSSDKHTMPVMLTWEQVREMSAHGIDFGSHGKSHNILTQITDEEIAEELMESRDAISRSIGREVYMISYPNGNYNSNILKITEAAKYIVGFTCKPGINEIPGNWLMMKRRHVREDVTLGFHGEFSELFFRIELSEAREHLAEWKII